MFNIIMEWINIIPQREYFPDIITNRVLSQVSDIQYRVLMNKLEKSLRLSLNHVPPQSQTQKVSKWVTLRSASKRTSRHILNYKTLYLTWTIITVYAEWEMKLK